MLSSYTPPLINHTQSSTGLLKHDNEHLEKELSKKDAQAKNYCFTSFQRIKTPNQFQAVYKSKQWGNSSLYSFNVLALSRESTPALLGVTVSKKVSKRAVDRNRLKRQIREFYRHRQHQLLDAHLVITAKPRCMKATDKERAESLKELWGKVQGWKRWHKRQIDNKQ